MTIFTADFLRAVAERAIKTLCQTAAAIIVAAGVGLVGADWISIISVAGMAAFVSVLTSVASGAVTESGSPSLSVESLPARAIEG